MLREVANGRTLKRTPFNSLTLNSSLLLRLGFHRLPRFAQLPRTLPRRRKRRRLVSDQFRYPPVKASSSFVHYCLFVESIFPEARPSFRNLPHHNDGGITPQVDVSEDQIVDHVVLFRQIYGTSSYEFKAILL